MKRLIFRTTAMLVTVLLALSLLASCSGRADRTSAKELKTYDSYTAITKLITKSLNKHNGAVGLWKNLLGARFATNDMAQEGAAAPTSGDSKTSGSVDYSTTNLQVLGVDEADIIKTDGEYLYIIANGRFLIVDVRNPQLMKVVSETVYIKDATDYTEKTITPIEMYLDTENHLATLICYTYDNRLYDAMKAEASGAASAAEPSSGTSEPAIAYDYRGYWGQQNVTVQVFDVSDPAAPAVAREFSQEGSYVSSRRVDEHVYLITNKYLYYFTDFSGEVSNDLLIPAYKDTEGTGEWEKFPVDSILVVEDSDNSNFLILSAIDTKNAEADISSRSILGAGQNVYASEEHIYIASARYNYDENTVVGQTSGDGTAVVTNSTAVKTDGVTNVSGAQTISGTAAVSGDTAEAPDRTDGAAPADSAAESTETVTGEPSAKEDISGVSTDVFRIFEAPVFTVFTDLYRFGIADGKVTAEGSGVVPGYVLNQYAMDEYNGYFRIATTTGESWRTDAFTSMNNLYVLDENLQVKGKVEGLGSTETIKSVRFMGNRAFMVTFRTTDPLFVFDLTDPAAPAVKGELKIPGYSEYLHPVSENIILGFGKNAVEVDGTAIEKGYKVSVFDVSDIANPKEISTLAIGERGTYSELSYNPIALLYSEEKNIIGFPITIYEIPETMKSDVWAYGVPVFSGFMVLGLTENNQLYERARIAHYEAEIPEGYPYDYTMDEKDWEAYNRLYSYSYLYAVKRGAFIGNTIFTVSDYMIKANSLADFSAIGEVKLPGFEEINYYYFNQPVYTDKRDDVIDDKYTDPASGTDGSGTASAEPGSTGSGTATDPAVKG